MSAEASASTRTGGGRRRILSRGNFGQQNVLRPAMFSHQMGRIRSGTQYLGVRNGCPCAKMSGGLLSKTPGSTTPNLSRNLLLYSFPAGTHLFRVETVLKGGVVVRGLPLCHPQITSNEPLPLSSSSASASLTGITSAVLLAECTVEVLPTTSDFPFIFICLFFIMT
jgi:hypothetical protein